MTHKSHSKWSTLETPAWIQDEVRNLQNTLCIQAVILY